MTIDSRDAKPDLDAQIRAAEQRVIAADRDWQLHSKALGTAVRGHAGRVATLGALGIGATIVGGLLVRWRLSARSRAREKLLSKALSAVRWPGATARAETEAAKAAPVIKSTALMSVLATVATLLGAAARTGLKLPAKPGVSSLVMRLLVPMATKWWRARASARPTPAPAVVPAPVPVPVSPTPTGTRGL